MDDVIVLAETFLSTPSARRATPCGVGQFKQIIFLSTPSARRATQRQFHCALRRNISIHALCEEGDCCVDIQVAHRLISIHALCEEGDPGRRARIALADRISIHALCEEGDTRVYFIAQRPANFYPRPLRGGRQTVLTGQGGSIRFLSTPSARRATGRAADRVPRERISIHALCEEGDPR